MSVVVVGLEHTTAPLDLLERATVADADLAKVLGELRDQANIEETVVVSTCLRTEVYAVVDRFHDAVAEVQGVLASTTGVAVPLLEQHLKVRFDDDVAAHLFEVAAGLDSVVLGESEVLGQVRRSWERAQGEHVSGPVLADLFRHAVETGKRVRSETSIARGTTSFSHAAVELAEERLAPGLVGATVVVVGAGQMGGSLVQALTSLPPGRRPAGVLVANRTLAKAEALRALGTPTVPVEVVAFDELAAVVARADVIFSAVEAERPVLRLEHLAAVTPPAGRLLVVDLGVPRNVERSVAGLDAVTLLDMDTLRTSVAQAMEERRSEAVAARHIVAEEVARYRAAARARGAAPVVAALRDRLEALRTAELARRRSQFAGLSEEDWSQVDAVTRSVLAKLVHEPSVLLKETAGTPRGDRLVEALRNLFDL